MIGKKFIYNGKRLVGMGVLEKGEIYEVVKLYKDSGVYIGVGGANLIVWEEELEKCFEEVHDA